MVRRWLMWIEARLDCITCAFVALIAALLLAVAVWRVCWRAFS